MERRFAEDFSDVRVHTGANAATSARSIHAQAYTVGSDVVFGDGRYAPGENAGRRLLAHELTHVVQQRVGIQLQNGVGRAGDQYERAANAMADRVTGQDDRPVEESGREQWLGQCPGSGIAAVQCYGDPIPTVARPTVKSMAEFIDLVRRIEAANPGSSALEVAEMIRLSKYHSRGFQQLLPDNISAGAVKAGEKVTAADVTTLEGEFDVTLPTGEKADPSHVVTAIEAAHEKKPADWGFYVTGGEGMTQLDIASWAGDVGSAAAEWATAHPLPHGGTTKEEYMQEFSPDSDLLGDIEGVALSSHIVRSGFAIDLTQPLSENLHRFYFGKNAAAGETRRFHTFCALLGFALLPATSTLSAAAVEAIRDRIHRFEQFYEHNDPNVLTWMALAGPKGDLSDWVNETMKQWTARADDWTWFAARFVAWLQRNLNTERV